MQLATFDVGMPGDPSFPVAESPRCSQSESEKAREKTDKHNAQILQQCSGEIRIVMMVQNTTPSFLFAYILRYSFQIVSINIVKTFSRCT